MPPQNFASKILKLSGKIFAKIIFLVFRRMMVLGKNLHTEIISGVSLRVSGDPSRPLPEPILGPSSALNPNIMAFGDFHDQGVKVWIQGAFGTVF